MINSDSHIWINAITSQAGIKRAEPGPDAFVSNTVLFLRRQSEHLIATAEKVRGIEHSYKTITLNGETKTVLYRDTTKAKATLTAPEQRKIANLEFHATWCISAAAAYNIANDLDKAHRVVFINELNKLIDRHITGDEIDTGKVIYERKMQSLASLMGAFFPKEKLKHLSDRLEAERDMLAIDEPTELVATFHQHPLNKEDLVYDIEFPGTKLSPEQRAFFTMVSQPEKYSDHTIGFYYDFYKHLSSWQQNLIKRYASKILQEDRLRPTQMQFLPMAPNFWTRYTVVKPNNKPAEVVNVMSRCGALSPRIKADADSIVDFQKMQYAQARVNLNLAENDKLCYTSYKQNFYGMGDDDSALENISKAHEADPKFNEHNPIFNIGMGRFAPLARIINGIHHFFFTNKFHDNDNDPLTEDAFRIVGRFIRNPHDEQTIDAFLNAKFSYSPNVRIKPELVEEHKKREIDIKLDLEQVYRHATEIEAIRKDYIVKDNKRVGALRSVLFHKLCDLKTKLEKLPGYTYKPVVGVGGLNITYQAYLSGCKSNIDRGTLVTFHAEVIALKEHQRRVWWNKEFSTVKSTPSYLSAKSFMTNVALHAWFPLTGIVNFFTTLLTGKNLVQHRADFALARMEQTLPIINARLNDGITAPSFRAELLKQKADLINEAVDTDISIEASVCQSGHSRIMPAHGGSLAVSGIKDSVVKAVAPHLEDQMVHLSSQEELSSHNHHLFKKCGVKASKNRDWVSIEHANAAESATHYNPPDLRYIGAQHQDEHQSASNGVVKLSSAPSLPARAHNSHGASIN